MEQMMITITVEEFKRLVEDSVLLKLLAVKARGDRYFNRDDIREFLGIKEEEE